MIQNFGSAILFRTVDSIREDADMVDINVDQPFILYCDVGNYGALAWFVLHELIGNTKVSLFDGSMHQWSMDPARRVVVDEDP